MDDVTHFRLKSYFEQVLFVGLHLFAEIFHTLSPWFSSPMGAYDKNFYRVHVTVYKDKVEDKYPTKTLKISRCKQLQIKKSRQKLDPIGLLLLNRASKNGTLMERKIISNLRVHLRNEFGHDEFETKAKLETEGSFLLYVILQT